MSGKALELFRRAVADNVSMPEAARRIAAERWAAVDARLARRRAGAHREPAADQPELWWQKQ